MNSKGAILLVEDNPDDELLALDAFRASRVTNTIVARNGAEALDYLFGVGNYAGRNTQELPSLVLLDLKLPKIDGLEVLRQIRANTRTRFLPVVILTSSDADEDLCNAYRLGANSYLLKPVDFDAFITSANHLGHYWLLLNKLPLGAQ